MIIKACELQGRVCLVVFISGSLVVFISGSQVVLLGTEWLRQCRPGLEADPGTRGRQIVQSVL